MGEDDRVSLCSPDWHGNYSTDEADLELRDPHAGLKAALLTTQLPSLILIFTKPSEALSVVPIFQMSIKKKKSKKHNIQ